MAAPVRETRRSGTLDPNETSCEEIAMTMPFLPMTHGLRTHLEEMQRIAWFVFESLEREHLIAWKALWATAPAAGLTWVSAWGPIGLVSPLSPRR